jgi:hypothetical protein
LSDDIGIGMGMGMSGSDGLKRRSAKKKVPLPVPSPPAATFAIIRVQEVKGTLVDHILGLHLPLAQVGRYLRSQLIT